MFSFFLCSLCMLDTTQTWDGQNPNTYAQNHYHPIRVPRHFFILRKLRGAGLLMADLPAARWHGLVVTDPWHVSQTGFAAMHSTQDIAAQALQKCPWMCGYSMQFFNLHEIYRKVGTKFGCRLYANFGKQVGSTSWLHGNARKMASRQYMRISLLFIFPQLFMWGEVICRGGLWARKYGTCLPAYLRQSCTVEKPTWLVLS